MLMGNVTIEDEDPTQLGLGQHLLPQLLGYEGRLKYNNNAKDKRVAKPRYKGYLEMVASNLKRMVDASKEDMKEADHKNPLIKQRTARELQSGPRGKAMLFAEEHSKVRTKRRWTVRLKSR